MSRRRPRRARFFTLVVERYAAVCDQVWNVRDGDWMVPSLYSGLLRLRRRAAARADPRHTASSGPLRRKRLAVAAWSDTGDGLTCTGINECATSDGGCHVHATCTNTPGPDTCRCDTGCIGTGTSYRRIDF